MNSIQLDFLGTLEKLNLVYDINLFYNSLTDIIVNNPNVGLSNDAKYINAGSLKVMGIEAEFNYQIPSFYGRANMTYQYGLEAEKYYYSDHKIYSVPSFLLTLTAEKRLFNLQHHALWLYGNMRFTSKTYNKANTRIPGSEDFYMDSRAIVDLGVRYDYNKRVNLSVDCENLLNTSYYIGGTFYVPYLYPGRTIMGTIAFTM
jgi:iron complex outermembrane receptor protein